MDGISALGNEVTTPPSGEWIDLFDPEQDHINTLFFDPERKGGMWKNDEDELFDLTLDPAETRAAVPNLHWLAYQEEMPLEEMSLVKDLYQPAYNQSWFGGTAKTEQQFNQAVKTHLEEQQRTVGFWESLVRSFGNAVYAIPEYFDRALMGFAVLGDGLDPIPPSAYDQTQAEWWEENVVGIGVRERARLRLQSDERQDAAGQIGSALGSMPRDLALSAATLALLPEVGAGVGVSLAAKHSQPVLQAAWQQMSRGAAALTGTALLNGMDAGNRAAEEGADLRTQTARALAETSLTLASGAMPMGVSSAAKTPVIRFTQRLAGGYAAATSSSMVLQQAQAIIEGRPDLSPDLKKVAIDSLPLAAIASILGPRVRKAQEGPVNSPLPQENVAAERQTKKESIVDPQVRRKLEIDWLNNLFSAPGRVVRKGDSVKAVLGFDLSNHQLSSLAGGHKGSKVIVECMGEDGIIHLAVESPHILQLSRTLKKEADGTMILYNVIFKKHQNVPRGFGTYVVSSEVREAMTLGVSKIETLAAGNVNTSDAWVGYEVWAKLGFDFELPEEMRKSLPSHLQDSATLQQLRQTPEGRDWWKVNGDNQWMEFDLKPKSSSATLLRSYLEKNGYRKL